MAMSKNIPLCGIGLVADHPGRRCGPRMRRPGVAVNGDFHPVGMAWFAGVSAIPEGDGAGRIGWFGRGDLAEKSEQNQRLGGGRFVAQVMQGA